MPWGTEIPAAPIRPAVSGWFAIFNLLAQQQVTVENAAYVLTLIAATQNAFPVNTAVAKGLQSANQSVTLANSGKSAGARTGLQTFSATESALLTGKPGADNLVPITDLGSVAGVVLSSQEVEIVSSAAITDFLVKANAPQVVPIIDSAKLSGILSAAESFSVLNGASVFGKPNASQAAVVTNSGAVRGISKAQVNLIITNRGQVYAKLTAATTFSAGQSALVYGKPGASQGFSVLNSAVAEEIENFIPTVFIVGIETATTTTCAIPPHEIGDEIWAFVYRGGSATALNIPASSTTVPVWTAVAGGTGADTNSARVVKATATVTNHTSGTWTGASDIIIVVTRGSNGVGGVAESGGVSNVQAIAPAITLQEPGDSLILHALGKRSVTAWGATPSGYKPEAYTLVSTGLILLSKDDSSTDGAVTQPLTGTNNGYRGMSVEIKRAANAPLVPPDAVKYVSCAAGSFATNGQLSWEHPGVPANSRVLVTLATNLSNYVRYNGIDMNFVATIAGTTLYEITDPVGGTGTITASHNGNAYVYANSFAYLNVDRIELVTTIAGSGGTCEWQINTVPLGALAFWLCSNYYSITAKPVGGRLRDPAGGTYTDMVVADSPVPMLFKGNGASSNNHGGIGLILYPESIPA